MKSIDNIYSSLLRQILLNGVPVSPRGMECKEIISHTTEIDMNYPKISVPEREIGWKFRVAEAAWILSGDNRLSTIGKYSKKIGDYSDDGKYFAGAYGPPFRDQLPYILRCLTTDKSSRQAVITIWRPRPYPSEDIPCTISLQFLLRHDSIHTVATMRSSDAWLGWPYDIYNFSCITAFIALHLDVDIGRLYLTAGSQHLYNKHLDKAHEIAEKTYWTEQQKLEWKGVTPDEFIENLWKTARR